MDRGRCIIFASSTTAKPEDPGALKFFAYASGKLTLRTTAAPGGENNLAVFALDPATGEPTLVQNIDTGGETQLWTGMIELP